MPAQPDLPEELVKNPTGYDDVAFRSISSRGMSSDWQQFTIIASWLFSFDQRVPHVQSPFHLRSIVVIAETLKPYCAHSYSRALPYETFVSFPSKLYTAFSRLSQH